MTAVRWQDRWYIGSLEAGRPLLDPAEIVHFSGKAEERLHQSQAENVGLEQTLFQRERSPLGRRPQHRRSGERLPANQVVQLLLQGATLALLVHLLILSYRTLLSKAEAEREVEA